MEELKRFREDKKLTQKEIAEIVGVSKSFYEKIENENKNPSYNFINKFTKAFPGISVDELFFKK